MIQVVPVQRAQSRTQMEAQRVTRLFSIVLLGLLVLLRNLLEFPASLELVGQAFQWNGQL
jgi:hypothetical protein